MIPKTKGYTEIVKITEAALNGDTGHYNRYIIDAMIEFKNQSSVNPTDDDIENAATDYINDAGVDLFCTDVEALVNAAYMAGAKEIRDNKIHISKSKV